MRVSRLLRISPLARDCQSVIPPPAIKQKEATRRAYRNIQLAALRNPQRGGRAEVDRAPPKALSDGESGPQGSLGSAKKRASPRKTMAGRGQGGHVQYRQQLTNNRFLVSSLIGGQLVGACASKDARSDARRPIPAPRSGCPRGSGIHSRRFTAADCRA